MIVVLSFLLGSAFAQDLELPVLSPRAMVSQQIGTVKVTLDYASPGARDRAVWGELVPYDKVWRTGANAATTLTTTGDVKIGGKDVPAGTYSVFTIPGEKSWTVILNSNAKANAGNYDEKLDVARFTATPVEGPKRERLTFLFSDTDHDSATLELEWAGVRLPIPVEVDSAGRSKADIEAYVARAARRLADAGKLLADNGDVQGGLALVGKSLAVQETWYGRWTEAQILSAKGEKKAAYQAAEKAMALGTPAGEGFFARAQVEKALAEWPKK
jgi:hypothetical protein